MNSDSNPSRLPVISSVASPDHILAVEHLNVFYETDAGPFPALQDISLHVERGARIAIVGESGSGKSTLGLAIAGFLNGGGVSVNAARLVFDGRCISMSRLHRLPSVPLGLAMVFQDAMTSLDPVWTIGSQINAVIRRDRRVGQSEARLRAVDWLGRVGLGADSVRVLGARPYELSGGMRQRAMLAIALCAGPRLLIADEPTSALDASLSREVMELLVRLTTDLGTTLILVTHDIFLCRQYTQRMIVMRGGRIVDDCAADRIVEDASDPYTRGLLRCVPSIETIGLARLPTMEHPDA